MDISHKIMLAVAHCFGNTITLEQPVYMERSDLDKLKELGQPENQLLAFMYQKIRKEETYNGLVRLEVKGIRTNIKVETKQHKGTEGMFLSVIKRVEMVDNQCAAKSDDEKKETRIQIRSTSDEKELWNKVVKHKNFKSLSDLIRSTLNEEATKLNIQ